MIKPSLRAFIIISVFFLLDLIKPFGYFLSVEFIFLGLIIIALNESLAIALVASFLSACFRNFFILNGSAVTLFEFLFICLLIQYIRSRRIFLAKPQQLFIVKGVIVFLSLCVHILVNSVQLGLFISFFSFQFLIQSICVYYFIDYLLNQKALPAYH